MGTLKYNSNNSGGAWWLTDQNWRDLEAEGWRVAWFKDSEFFGQYARSDGRWLGALAQDAEKEFASEAEGIAEWERITGQSADDEGCWTCGSPHYFDWEA